ncbi:hypothetical protein GSH19_03780 [Lactobacillus sp. S2-2]|uniref:ADP-ribosyltransferase n=1 Tax=Lactobacillus sp. S2-2 TaxID=2692917 RepID=UPI001EFFC4B5|nr:ADP-ribosyltransferase [Lactobacillus sp. S2-2]MCF6515273.1 hypothetical protein [Lactobacillus sp. S2-2]
MKKILLAITVTFSLSFISLNDQVEAKNQSSSVTINTNTDNQVTNLTDGQYLLNKSVNGYELDNNQPNLEKTHQLAADTQVKLIQKIADDAIIETEDGQKLMINNFNDNVYKTGNYSFSDKKYKKLLKDSKLWAKKLSKKEYKAVGDYTGNKYYKDINKSLITGKSKNAFIKNTTKSLKSATNKFYLPFDLTVYRGTNEGLMNLTLNNQPLKVGAMIQNKGYSSATLSKNTAVDYSDGVLYKINVPKGYHGAYIEPLSKFKTEKEYLINPNAKMRVTKIQSVDYNKEITLDATSTIGKKKPKKMNKTYHRNGTYKLVTLTLVN